MRAADFIVLRCPIQSLQETYRIPDKNFPSIFELGVFLSSQEYWNEFKKAGDFLSSAKLKLTFYKYWIRSCTRCTPFGVFAGIGLIYPADSPQTDILINHVDLHTSKTRLDANFLVTIIKCISENPELLEKIKFYPNDSIYELPDGLRYAEYILNDNVRKYQLISVDKEKYITAILDYAKTGVTLDNLIGFLVTMENVSREEAREFIITMYHSQLLVSDLEPCLTGIDPLTGLIQKLVSIKFDIGIINELQKIRASLQNAGSDINLYKEISDLASNLVSKKYTGKNIFQTDLFLSLQSNQIDTSIIDTLVDQVNDLFALRIKTRNYELNRFITKFKKKYENQLLPLSIALDAEFGIGYSDSDDSISTGEMADNIKISPFVEEKPDRDLEKIQQFALHKYIDYSKKNTDYIEITVDDIKSLEKGKDAVQFAASMYVLGSLFKTNSKLSEKDFVFDLIGIGGPSGANLLGRFTYADTELYRLTKQLLVEEEKKYNDCILAEIVHLPQSRLANVLLRPLLRNYEIPYLGKSGADKENQITINDLLIGVRDNEIILLSKKFNKRVIPRLTTAHNFGYYSLPVYKFLCDLQTQSLTQPVYWDWGSLSGLKSLPRVVYKNIIVRKAMWQVYENDILDLPETKQEYKVFFKRLCAKMKLPSRCLYIQNDNKLLIDFTENTGIELFLHYLKKNKRLLLEEFLFDDDNCIINDKEGRPYTNEVIIPLQEEKKLQENNFLFETDRLAVKEKFPPASEWLYFKIYTGPKVTEKILKQNILPFINHAFDERAFLKFFFVRYKDENPHLRIRFYNTDSKKQDSVSKDFNAILKGLMDSELIEKITIDTYQREIPRYNPVVIEEIEDLFYYDSLSILRLIDLLENNESGEKYRIIMALRGIDSLLNDFGLTQMQKIGVLSTLQRNFFNEFGKSLPLRRILNDMYRKHQQFIFSHMNPNLDTSNEIDDVQKIFSERSVMSRNSIEIIKSKIQKNDSIESLLPLINDYIHMSMNRLFVTNQRKYELIVYHYLDKFYNSQKAIQTKK